VDTKPDEKPDIEEQAQVAKEFAKGLLEAFGLEGEVETRIEDDILYIDINGEQTEALVGRKGAVVQAVHELTRTVIQRRTFGAPRMRLDIAGYAARRREALRIYAGRLAESVKEDGREAMLEPMNAADRKVVHDAIAEIDGVRSYSEGEDPNRSVIVAPADD
jgi:spoIIIJ-associated protein